MTPGRVRITTDSPESLQNMLSELVNLAMVDPTSIRQRQVRKLWVAYARLSSEFSNAPQAESANDE